MPAENTDPPAHEEAIRSFGRRRGKRLRANQARLMETVLPSLRVDDKAPGDFACDASDLWLEIGFGGGEHLAQQARTHPDIAFIGCEPFLNGIAKLLSAIDEHAITNIRIWPDDVRMVLDGLGEQTVGRCFILFPDPWPKKRHTKRRLIQPVLLDRLARVMTDGAELRIASDDMGYVRWTLGHLMRHPAFEWLAEGPGDWRTPPPDWVATRYEQKALARGARAAYLRFRRRDRQPG